MTELGVLAEGPLFGLPLPAVWFGLLFFILGTFLALDGFDFGVGVIFATRSDSHEREQLVAAIGPVWDGNEVWLVVFGGALFAAFPTAYANLFSRHYLLMFAILGALIVRGLAPEMYELRPDEQWRRWWGRAFVAGSAGAPFLLGMFVANWLLGSTRLLTVPGLLVGLALLTLSVVDGVAFLRIKTRGELRADLQAIGYLALGAYVVLVVATLAYLYLAVASIRPDLLSPVSIALVGLTVTLATAHAAATVADRYYAAFVTAVGLVFALTGLVAALMYPAIDPAGGLTARSAAVSTLPLNLMTIGAAILLPLVFVYFYVLYSAFAGPVEAGEAY